MAIITIDNLAPGMLLRSNVCDRSGRMLLPAGNALTEKHLKIFRTWGISEADVEGDENGDITAYASGREIEPALLSEAEAAVTGLFVHNNPGHPVIGELMRICIQRRIDHVS